MKKFISVFTAMLVMALFVCPLCVSAAGNPEFAVMPVSVAAGEEAKVDITLNSNPGIISAKLKVEFDSALTLKSVKFGDGLGGSTQSSPELKSPLTLNWVILEVEPENMDKDTVFATLVFGTENAKPGNYDVKISYNPGDVYNADEKNIEFKTVDGVVTVTGGDAVGDGGVLTTGEEPSYEELGEYTGGEENIMGEDDAAAEEEESDGGNPIGWILGGATAAVIAAALITVIIINNKKKNNAVD